MCLSRFPRPSQETAQLHTTWAFHLARIRRVQGRWVRRVLRVRESGSSRRVRAESKQFCFPDTTSGNCHQTAAPNRAPCTPGRSRSICQSQRGSCLGRVLGSNQARGPLDPKRPLVNRPLLQAVPLVQIDPLDPSCLLLGARDSPQTAPNRCVGCSRLSRGPGLRGVYVPEAFKKRRRHLCVKPQPLNMSHPAISESFLEYRGQGPHPHVPNHRPSCDHRYRYITGTGVKAVCQFS